MILNIEAGLPALAPPPKRRKYIRVAAAVEEETFSFAQPDKINARLEKMSAPGVREVARDSKGQGRARSIRKWRNRIRRGEDFIGAGAFVNRSLKQSLRRKSVQPSEDRGVLPQVALGVAADKLIIGNIGLLKICARTHHQQLERIFVPRVPIELRGGSRAFAKVKKLLRLGRIEIAPGSETVRKKVISELARLSAVVGV